MCFTLLRLIAQIQQRPDSNITPEIDKIRDRAIRFSNNYSQISTF